MNFGDRRNFFGVRRTIGHYEYRNRWFSVHFEPAGCRARPGAQKKRLNPVWAEPFFGELGSDSIAVVQLSMRSNDEIESDPNSLKQTNNLAAGELRHALGSRLFGKTRHCHDVTALRDDVTRPG